MEELQAKNNRLQTLVKQLEQNRVELQKKTFQLQKEIQRLQTDCASAYDTIRKMQAKCDDIQFSATRVILDTIQYCVEDQKPIMLINSYKIQFTNPSDKEARLAEIVCKPRNLNKLAKAPVSIEAVYDWYKNTDDWFSLTSGERSAFQKSLYNSFRRLNDKIAPYFQDKKLFVVNKNNLSLNSDLEFLRTAPKAT